MPAPVANDILAADPVMLADVEQLKAVQDELTRLAEQASTEGGLRADLNLALLQLQRYALAIVHVVTGRLKNSIFVEVEERGNDLLVGHLATNVAYALEEERRPGERPGFGSHAFFGRTIEEEGPNVNDIFQASLAPGGAP